jgi:hypothetical protein
MTFYGSKLGFGAGLCNAFSVKISWGACPRVGRRRDQPWATVFNRDAVKSAGARVILKLKVVE